MRNLFFILLLAACTQLNAQIVNIPDFNFKNALVNTNCVDTNGDGVWDSDADANDDGEIQITEAENVFWLNVAGEAISSLEGIEYFLNLEELICFDNNLNNLDFSQNINLVRISCWLNQLTNLNISQNINLEELVCLDNQLTDLDVSQNPNLTLLVCEINQIVSLDLSFLSNLNYLYCGSNLLTSLDIKNGNNHNMIDMEATNNPNLSCIQVDDENATYPECGGFPLEGWCKDTWASYSEKCNLGLIDLESVSFTISPNPTNDVIHFTSTNNTVLSASLYTVEGKLTERFKCVYQNLDEISIAHLKSGIYILKIETDKGQTIKKVIKN